MSDEQWLRMYDLMKKGGAEGIEAFTDLARHMYEQGGTELLLRWTAASLGLLPEHDQGIMVVTLLEAWFERDAA